MVPPAGHNKSAADGDGSSVVPKLKRALTQEQDTDVKRSIRQAIALLDDTPGDDVDPESQELLNALGPVQPVETGVRHRLGDKAFEMAVEKYRRVMNNKAETVPRRSQAAMLLGKLGAKAAVSDLLDIVEDDESAYPTRVFAAQALAKIGDWEAVPRLEKALAAEQNATIRLKIQSVVAELSGMKLMDLDDVDADVRRWLQVLGTDEPAPFQALNELIKLGEKSIDPARVVFSNESELYTRRWQAAKALGVLKAKRAMPELLAVVEGDDNRIVTAVAAEALGRIGDRSVLPPLKKALAAERDPYVRQAIEEAVKTLEDG